MAPYKSKMASVVFFTFFMYIRPHKINSLVLRPNFAKLDEGGRLFFFFFIGKKTDEGGFFLFGKEINYLKFKKQDFLYSICCFII